jgi:hypothetical protein
MKERGPTMKHAAIFLFATLVAAPGIALDAYPTMVIAEMGTQDD